MASLPPTSPFQQPLPPKPPTSFGDKLKKYLGPLGGLLVLIFNFLGKLKFIVLPVIKFLPVLLKTGGTMVLSIGVYALAWGWWFAAGFVVLIFIHECGHLVFARRLGLKVGAPVFIPFMGAFIALKDARAMPGWKHGWALAAPCSERLAPPPVSGSSSQPATHSSALSPTRGASSICSTWRRSAFSMVGVS